MIPILNKLVSENGVAYHRAGNGPCLLLIHGVGLRAESWYPLLASLAEHFDLIVIDLPGHGESRGLSKNFETVQLTDYLEVIEAFITSIGVHQYYVCGHSLGALLAIHIAVEQQDKITGLVALNAVYQRSDEATIAVKERAKSLSESDSVIGIKQTIDRWFTRTPSPDMERYASVCEYWLRTNSVEGYSMAYKTFAEKRGPSPESLNRVNCESVFITGELDSNSSPQMTHQLCSSTKRAKAIIVDGAGHMMPLTHWQIVHDSLLDLKRQVDEGRMLSTISSKNSLKSGVKKRAMTEFDSKALRRAFGSFMTGVTVVTTVDRSGAPVGFTANSFSSVSMDPPLLLVCPAKSLSSFHLFNECSNFHVSVLAHDQQAVSNIFASGEEDRFSKVEWQNDANGCPQISGAIASFACERYQSVDAGDHVILLGKVTEFEAHDLQGLGYGVGGYFSLNMERKATELQTSEESIVVGAIVEQGGKILLRKSDIDPTKWSVPELEIGHETPSFDAIEEHLSGSLGGTINVGSVYSIFDHDSENKSFIYYRVSLNEQYKPLEAEGVFHDFEKLEPQAFNSKATYNMLNRYISERSTGNHRVYIGSESKGKTHKINRGL